MTVHVPYISFVRKTLGILNQGPKPPPVLRLNDGGHVENLSILPLLKLGLKKIISVHGGQASSEQEFCNTLLNALEMARQKLRCSFTGLDCRDISEAYGQHLWRNPLEDNLEATGAYKKALSGNDSIPRVTKLRRCASFRVTEKACTFSGYYKKTWGWDSCGPSITRVM